MTITPDHLLSGVPFQRLPMGGAMPIRRCVVLHFTAGATGQSSIDSMRKNGLSAHLVIDRDGAITQCVPFNRVAFHAGRSRWKDPHTGILYRNLNSCSIGIEIANAGNDAAALSWARQQPGFRSVRMKHRNGGRVQEWEDFYDAQTRAVTSAVKALVDHYNLDDVTSHDCIAPERKDDVGPAFPLAVVRAFCGFAGLPVVHWP